MANNGDVPGDGSAAGPGTWVEVADRVWTGVLEPDAVTIGLVAGGDGLLVVDTGSTPAQGAALRASAERLTGLPVRAVVVTHAHSDHAFGLAAFDDVDTFGHEGLADELASAPARARAAELGVDPGDLRTPSRPFALAAGVDLGARWVELAHLGVGHTRSDVVVVVPDARVVFVGDLAESAPSPVDGSPAPWFGPDSVPEEWAATLDAVLGLVARGDVRAVPGHGPVMTVQDLMLQRGQVAAVAGEVERLVRAGVPAERAVAEGRWPFPAEHVAEGVPVAHARLVAAGVRPDPPQLPLLGR
ncbi:MBL fold metallo-hydrolase [Desertihabitans brevis]|nr:MBL fold metallo-hydrolase [Desertihabitans brevis]